MLKKFIFISLSFLSAASFAAPGFISHKIINQTNTDLDIILRQIYKLPILGCMDKVPAKGEITCAGSFDNAHPYFIFDILSSKEPMLDTEYTVQSKTISEHQSVFLTWTLEEKSPGKVTLNVKMSY